MSTTNVTRTPAMATADILNWQAERVKLGQFEYIGKAWMIVLEVAKGAHVPEFASIVGSRLEFFGGGVPLAQTPDHSTLLLLAPIVRPDGQVGLPDIPDPTWQPPIPKPHEIANLPPGKVYHQPKPPMIAQKLEDRARGKLKGTDYLVFGPVAQILIRPEGIPEGWIAGCSADLHTGTQMDLLISARTGTAHLFGGRYEITRIG